MKHQQNQDKSVSGGQYSIICSYDVVFKLWRSHIIWSHTLRCHVKGRGERDGHTAAANADIKWVSLK